MTPTTTQQSKEKGRGTRMRYEDKGLRQGKRTMRDNDDDEEDEED